MGLCIDSDENEQGIDFEIRRESVVLYTQYMFWHVDSPDIFSVGGTCR